MSDPSMMEVFEELHRLRNANAMLRDLNAALQVERDQALARAVGDVAHVFGPGRSDIGHVVVNVPFSQYQREGLRPDEAIRAALTDELVKRIATGQYRVEQVMSMTSPGMVLQFVVGFVLQRKGFGL